MKRRLNGCILIALCILLLVGCASRLGSASLPNRLIKDTGVSLKEIPHGRLSIQKASALYFLNPAIGWALTSKGLYSTRDGGKTWTFLYDDDIDLQKFIFVNDQDGWGFTNNWGTEKRSSSVFRTQDGGRSWRKVLEAGTPLYTIDFINERIGYVSGRWLPLQLTTDGGETWKNIEGNKEGIKQIFFYNEKDGYGYGDGICR